MAVTSQLLAAAAVPRARTIEFAASRLAPQPALTAIMATAEAISTIAFDEGFNDLSTFNRRFRRIIGQSPRAHRASKPRGGG